MTRLVVIQHALEQTEPSNTVRAAVAALPSLEVRVFGAPGVALRVEDLAGAWLLWPEGAPRAAGERPDTLVVLDGSWSQARRISQRIAALRGLRRWSLPAPAQRVSLRAAPPGGMSTIEALAAALEALDGPAAGAPLREAHEALVRRQLADRGYVGPMR